MLRASILFIDTRQHCPALVPGQNDRSLCYKNINKDLWGVNLIIYLTSMSQHRTLNLDVMRGGVHEHTQ